MKLRFSCRDVAMKSLDSAEDWDLHPFLPSGKTLFQSRDSIQRSGLLYLPLVRKNTKGGYEVITGKRCVDFYHARVPQEKVLCRVLAEDVSMMQILALLYEEHAMRGEMTAIEQAHFVFTCRNRLSEPEQVQLFEQLGFSGTPFTLTRFLELLELADSLQAALWEGTIAENMARELLRLKEEDRRTFYDLVVRLGFGGGKQKRLLSLLKDLAGRNGVSFQTYLDKKAISAILDHPEMNIPQKGQMLLQLLQQGHSPALTGAESRFLSWSRQLNLPQHCSVEHSPSFEQDDVWLKVRFTNPEKLEVFLATFKEEL